jgi:hypothetical protein
VTNIAPRAPGLSTGARKPLCRAANSPQLRATCQRAVDAARSYLNGKEASSPSTDSDLRHEVDSGPVSTERYVKDPEFERKHPRGQPTNKGQFIFKPHARGVSVGNGATRRPALGCTRSSTMERPGPVRTRAVEIATPRSAARLQSVAPKTTASPTNVPITLTTDADSAARTRLRTAGVTLRTTGFVPLAPEVEAFTGGRTASQINPNPVMNAAVQERRARLPQTNERTTNPNPTVNSSNSATAPVRIAQGAQQGQVSNAQEYSKAPPWTFPYSKASRRIHEYNQKMLEFYRRVMQQILLVGSQLSDGGVANLNKKSPWYALDPTTVLHQGRPWSSAQLYAVNPRGS